jgi:hypothetical protein
MLRARLHFTFPAVSSKAVAGNYSAKNPSQADDFSQKNRPVSSGGRSC